MGSQNDLSQLLVVIKYFKILHLNLATHPEEHFLLLQKVQFVNQYQTMNKTQYLMFFNKSDLLLKNQIK